MSLSIPLVILFLVSLSPSLSCSISTISSVSIPKTIQDALSDLGWQKAMELEMTASHQNGMCDLIPLPPGKYVVGCKWVYIVKFHPDGSVDLLKVQLVANGYT